MIMNLSRYMERDNTPSLIAAKMGFCEGVLQKIFLSRTYLLCGRHRGGPKVYMLSNIFHASYSNTPSLGRHREGPKYKTFWKIFSICKICQKQTTKTLFDTSNMTTLKGQKKSNFDFHRWMRIKAALCGDGASLTLKI